MKLTTLSTPRSDDAKLLSKGAVTEEKRLLFSIGGDEISVDDPLFPLFALFNTENESLANVFISEFLARIPERMTIWSNQHVLKRAATFWSHSAC